MFILKQKNKISHTARHTPRAKNGFVLTFAVLLAGILLTIGLGLFSITYKELILSSHGRESQLAFYAADSGGECALYWDIRHDGFDYSVFATSSYSVSPTSGVICNTFDVSAVPWTVTSDPNKGVTTFDVSFPSNGTCATVTITKENNTTKIESRGFNTCLTSNRKVERGLKIKY